MDFGRGAGAPAHIAALSALLIVSVVHLTGQIFAAHSPVTEFSLILIVPALAAILYTATAAPRGRIVRVGFAALFFSWLGDMVPRFMENEPGFVVMLAFFTVAQVGYILALLPYRRRSVITKPLVAGPYLAVMTVLLAICFPGAGALFLPVVAYGIVIVAMALLATALGPAGAIGGLMFLASDTMIALGAFSGITIPGEGFWVMITYVLAQTLLVQAIIGQEERDTPSAPEEWWVPSHLPEMTPP